MSNIIPFKTKYPLMPVPEAMETVAIQLGTLANILEQGGLDNQAADIREAASRVQKVAGELKK